MPAKPHKIAQNRQYKAFMLTKFDLCQYNLAETKEPTYPTYAESLASDEHSVDQCHLY